MLQLSQSGVKTTFLDVINEAVRVSNVQKVTNMQPNMQLFIYLFIFSGISEERQRTVC